MTDNINITTSSQHDIHSNNNGEATTSLEQQDQPLCSEILQSYSNDITTCDVYVSDIPSSLAHKALIEISNLLPINDSDIKHCKRINSSSYNNNNTKDDKQYKTVSILLHKPDVYDSVSDIIKQQLITTYNIQPYIVTVCNTYPMTPEQWNKARIYWPLAIPCPKPIQQYHFNNNEKNILTQHMNYTIQLALASKQIHNQLPRACIIVDPKTNEKIAESVDHRLPHSDVNAFTINSTMQHTEQQHSSIPQKRKYVDTSDITLSNNNTKRIYHVLHHCAITCIDSLARQQKHEFDNSNNKNTHNINANETPHNHRLHVLQESPMLNSNDMVNVNDSIIDKQVEQCERQYLCTGYDVYMSHEPCLMCSMALLHSRIRTVYYAISNKQDGALGSNHQLHLQQSLNHHFKVFSGLLYDKAMQLLT